MSPHHLIILKQKSRIMDARPNFVLLYSTACCLWSLIAPATTASCDNPPKEHAWTKKPQTWRLESSECPERFYYLQVGDVDNEDSEDRLSASLGSPVKGFKFQPSSIKLDCDNVTIVERGLREYSLDVIVRDGCDTHSLEFQMKVVFTDIADVSNQHDPRLTASNNPVDVVKDLFETDGETDVVTLYCSDEDNDEITSVNITKTGSLFSVIATSTPTTFTLRLIGSLKFEASSLTLTLEVVDDGNPPRTGTTELTVNIQDDAPTTTTTTTTTTTSTTTTPTTTTTTPNVTTTSQPDNITEGPTRVDEQGGQGETMKMVGWGVGAVLAVMFVITIVLVYARKHNKLCFTSKTTKTDDTLFPTQESVRRSPQEATLDIYHSTPLEDDYQSIGHVNSTCSGSMDLATDYTNAGIAPSDSGTQGVSNGAVVPSSQADYMIPRPKYAAQRIYDNNRYNRPSHRLY